MTLGDGQYSLYAQGSLLTGSMDLMGCWGSKPVSCVQVSTHPTHCTISPATLVGDFKVSIY